MYTYHHLPDTTERQKELLTLAQEHLKHIKDKFPEVASLTLYIKHEYGHSTMRVYLTKDVYARTQHHLDTAIDPLIENDLENLH